jgi:hypothetical protein
MMVFKKGFHPVSDGTFLTAKGLGCDHLLE